MRPQGLHLLKELTHAYCTIFAHLSPAVCVLLCCPSQAGLLLKSAMTNHFNYPGKQQLNVFATSNVFKMKWCFTNGSESKPVFNFMQSWCWWVEWLMIHAEVCVHDVPAARQGKELTKRCEGILPWLPASWFLYEHKDPKERETFVCAKGKGEKEGGKETWSHLWSVLRNKGSGVRSRWTSGWDFPVGMLLLNLN